MSRSLEWYRRALDLFPGGVSSPVRAFSPYPRYLVRGEGPYVEDLDGQTYVDLCLAYGPLILGHSPPSVRKALEEEIRKGWIFGAPHPREVELAEEVRRRFPFVEKMRFVSTGTEATQHALRLARGATGRDVVVKVEGGFHGSHDSVLVEAGSGALTHGVPSSLGVPRDVAKLTRVVPFNDVDSLEKALRPADVACVLLEPILANVGVVLPEKGYLEEVRRLTRERGTLLVFDEIVTGFRVSWGGAFELFRVQPDLVTLGKVLGGGLPLSAFGGSRELLKLVSPDGPVYQAGTFSGNPLSLVAGLSTLARLTPEVYRNLEERTRELSESLEDALRRHRTPFTLPWAPGLLSLFLCDPPIRSWKEALRSDRKAFGRLHLKLLDRGVYLPPSPFESWFLSTEHGPTEIERVVRAFEEALPP